MKSELKKMVAAAAALAILSGCTGGLGKRSDARKASNGLTIEFVGTGDGTPASLGAIENTLTKQTTVSIANFRQVAESMASAGGVQVDDVTLALLQENKTILALTGSTDEITAPMWMAVTELAGSVCSQVLRVEEALSSNDRRFFKSFLFTENAGQVSSAQIQDAIRRLARGFYGRNESTEERDRLVALYESISQGETDVRKGLLAVCTVVAGSVSAQTM